MAEKEKALEGILLDRDGTPVLPSQRARSRLHSAEVRGWGAKLFGLALLVAFPVVAFAGFAVFLTLVLIFVSAWLLRRLVFALTH